MGLSYKEIVAQGNVYVPVESNVENVKEAEDKIYKHLLEALDNDHNEVLRNYECEEYPFECTFYLPSFNLYIECQFGEEHGLHPFNKNNKKDVELLNKYAEEGREDICETWADLDVLKREIASDKCLNWIEIFQPDLNMLDLLIDLELNGLYPNTTKDRLIKEFRNYDKNPGNLSVHAGSNYIVREFQPQLSDVYNEIYYGHVENKWNLVMNRSKYLFKPISELTKNDMLKGLRIAFPNYKYSMFNPKLIKWFANHEGMEGKICYDPCGGWGHRMLGAQACFSKYIYNDLSHSTVEGVKAIKDCFGLDNVIIHEGDAMEYVPEYDYDCMFTCPPYFSEESGNVETYECDGFNTKEQFDKFILKLYDLYASKESCKCFGLVIREDMVPEEIKPYVKEEFCLKTSNSHFVRATAKLKDKQNKEFLYIFRKEQ